MSNRWKGGFIQAFFDPLTEGPAVFPLYTWGDNGSGRLGLNTDQTVDTSSPTQVGGINWAAVSANQLILATTDEGYLWSWGRNGNGELGLGDVISRSSPVQVGALNTWDKVSAGSLFSAAIKTDGTLWMWGDDFSGQLAQNTTNVDRSSPVQIGSLTDWAEVSAAKSASCFAIKTDGTLWSWGSGFAGVSGHNDEIRRSSPVQVGSLTTWAKLSAGGSFCAAIKTDGSLWTWGFGNNGRLGHNDAISRSSPVQVGALTTWLSVSAGYSHCAAIKTDGTLWIWGNGGQGRLGLNQPDTDTSSPVQVGALNTWSQVSLGSNHSLAIKTDGTIWSWGDNGAGELGQNDVVDRSSPVQVGSATTWYQASAGYDTSAVIESS